MNRVVFSLAFLILAVAVKGQSEEFPKVGEVFPNIKLKDIQYYPEGNFELSRNRNKWIVLDFWNQHCPSCIESFPKLNSLQAEFLDKIQLVLIGFNGSRNNDEPADKSIRKLYEKVRTKYKLNLSVAYDSLLFRRFGISACPLIFVIDSNRILRGITNSIEENDLNDFLNNKQPLLSKAFMYQPELKAPYNSNLPFLVNGNGGNDTSFTFRRLLTKWKTEMPLIAPQTIKDAQATKFEALGVPIQFLYEYAFLGQAYFDNNEFNNGYYNGAVLQIKDSSLFKYDYRTGENVFTYSLVVPPEKYEKSTLMKMMQNDLFFYFGYKVGIEERRMPYWKLVIKDSNANRLKTKKETQEYWSKLYPGGLSVKNVSFKTMLDVLYTYQDEKLFMVDETGWSNNIDIDVDCLLNDINSLKKELNKNGLDLIKSEKIMKVLVIKDNR